MALVRIVQDMAGGAVLAVLQVLIDLLVDAQDVVIALQDIITLIQAKVDAIAVVLVLLALDMARLAVRVALQVLLLVPLGVLHVQIVQ